jgi:hypothetical protein
MKLANLPLGNARSAVIHHGGNGYPISPPDAEKSLIARNQRGRMDGQKEGYVESFFHR